MEIEKIEGENQPVQVASELNDRLGRIVKWKSKKSNLIVTVVKVENGAVWYSHPSWSNIQNCEKGLFLESMVPLDGPEFSTFIRFDRDDVDFEMFGL